MDKLLKEIEDYLSKNPGITRSQLQSRVRKYYDYLNRNNLMNNYIPVQDNHIYFKYEEKFDNNIFNEIQEFINSNNISSLSTFTKNFPEICKKAKISGVSGKLKFKEQNKWKKEFNFDNPKELQKFIDYFEVKSPRDLIYCFGSTIYKPFCKFHKEIEYLDQVKNKYKGVTLEQVQKIIDDNNYETAKDFRAAQRGLYGYVQSQKTWLRELKYKKAFKSWIHINTLEEFNKFIQENNITSSKDFRENYGGLAIRASRLKLEKHLVFCKNSSGFRSAWEKDLFDLINNDRDFINLDKNVCFDDCKNENPLPFDLVFQSSKNPNINFIIEIQGPTHFTEIYGKDRLIKTRKNDIIKNRWVKKKKDFYLFYYTNLQKIRCHSFNKRSFYPYYIYTSVKELLDDVKKLI